MNGNDVTLMNEEVNLGKDDYRFLIIRYNELGNVDTV